MVKSKISGITVETPFEPYEAQKITMTKLIECFQSNKSALIESPTGTGKSISILCSALAYLDAIKKLPNFVPVKIFICSRTHKQLDQLVEQLNKTIYKPRITILGSRKQYCINPLLKEEADKNKGCDELLKNKKCGYFHKKDALVKKIGEKIFDIDELREEGKKCHGCPYFAARALQEDADVVFCPYNYLVETSIRESMDIQLTNAIVIIDEAHNIEDCCRSAGSTELTSRLLDIILHEITNGVKKAALLGDIQLDFINLTEIFRKLKDHSITKEFNVKGYDSSSIIRKGKEIISELEKIGITKERFLNFKNSLQNILKHEEAKTLFDSNMSIRLQEIERTIGMVLFTDSNAYAYCFSKDNSEFGFYSYSFWLLDPSITFLPLASQVKSLSLLSGTLTPFASFESELKCHFAHKISAPHILRNEQVFVSCIKKGHLNIDLNGTYNVADTPEYLLQLERIIKDIAEETRPYGGTLIFVPSYSFLNKLAKKLKDAVVENRDGGMVEFERMIESYKVRIKNKTTSIFLCVHRGKAAEGIDFRDEYARAVICIGIPYPSIRDPQIGCKKEYNDKNGKFNGRLWYETQAFRAVNQAVGRTIRHFNDWGAVFLLDSRYAEKRVNSQLPSWVSSNLNIFDNYEVCKNKFRNFLSNHK